MFKHSDFDSEVSVSFFLFRFWITMLMLRVDFMRQEREELVTVRLIIADDSQPVIFTVKLSSIS